MWESAGLLLKKFAYMWPLHGALKNVDVGCGTYWICFIYASCFSEVVGIQVQQPVPMHVLLVVFNLVTKDRPSIVFNLVVFNFMYL
jgi:hypothetical protein